MYSQFLQQVSWIISPIVCCLSHNYMSQSYFGIINKKYRTDDNFFLSLSPLHARNMTVTLNNGTDYIIPIL